jgi:hypothetical protein
VPRRANALVWPFLVAIGALAALVPGILPGRTLAWRDSAFLHGPVRILVVEALRNGKLPLWNPWEGGGQPILEQAFHAALHPASVATACLSDSIDLFLTVLVMSAALGAWVAARASGAGAAAAAVAGFGYGLSGYVLGMTSNATYLTGAATMPWAVAGLTHAASSPTGWILAAAGVAAAALAGDPGALIAGLAIGLGLAAGRGGVLRASAGAALGIAGGAVQLLPTLAYLPQTLRGALGSHSSAGIQWPLDPARLPEIVSPGLFVGIPHSFRAPVFEAMGSPSDVPFPWAPSVFLGAPLLLLAVRGAQRDRSGRILLALAVFFLWVSMGRHAGATQILGAVPVWGALRFWEKMVAPLSLCVALAAALGVEDLRGARPRWTTMSGAALLAIGGLVALAPTPGSAAGGLYQARLAQGMVFAGASLLALAAAAAWDRRNREAGARAIVLVVFLQSIATAPFALHYGSASALREHPPPIDAQAPGPRVISPLVRNFEVGDGERDGIDRSHAREYRTGRPATNVRARIQNAEAYTGFGSARTAILAGAGELKWPLLRRFGATHVVAPEPDDEEDREAVRLATGPAPEDPVRAADGIAVWALAHRPWASFSSAARSTDGVRAAALALAEELRAGSEVDVMEWPSALPTGPGRVLSISRGADEVAIEAQSDGPALLVVNDAFAPGWVAEIDGSPTPILPSNVLARAIQWPPGRHRLVMRYEPPAVALGVATSAAAVAVAFGALLMQRRRRKPR